MKRRRFLQVAGAAGLGAAAACTPQEKPHLLPYVNESDDLIPGIAEYYASTCRECPAGCGIHVKTREARAIKVEGNPDHPVGHGRLCARGQAALQGLYDPDRVRRPHRRTARGLEPVAWDEAIAEIATAAGTAAASGPDRVALVTGFETGALDAFYDRWLAAFRSRRRLRFEAFAYEPLREAARLAFGVESVPEYSFADAKYILSFGADFLETWLSTVGHARGFARMHTFRDGRAGTFIHVEPRQSLTASNADQWIRNAPGTEAMLALAVLRVMIDEGLADRRFAEAVAKVDVARVAEQSGVPAAQIKHVAEVFGHARPGLAVGGGVAVTGSNAVEALAAVNLLNAAAGNVGRTVRFGPDAAFGKVTPYAQVVELAKALERGEIKLLLLGPGVNPAFTLPGGLKFADAIRKAGLVVSFANAPDETTALAGLVLPDTHWLESWGDYAPREGVTGLMQPAMAPVRDAKPMGDTLLLVARAVLGTQEGAGPLPWATFEQYLASVWQPVVKGGWGAALERGGLFKEVAAAPVTAKAAPLDPAPATLEGDAGGFALLAYPSIRFYDGRAGTRAWLQETADAMTQAVWDAWVEVPAAAAVKLGITPGDVVRVTSPHGAIELPAYVSATLHDGAVAIPIGHRYAPYHVPRYIAAPSTPMNPVALLSGAADPASGAPDYLGVRVSLTRTGARRPLAILQATHDQEGRELARHVDLRAAREEALRGRREPEEHPSMYPEKVYPGYRWGLSIDVDACIGCAACMVACQAENNVPVVGKAQAAYGRQLHWIRIERWAEGPAERPANTFLPMLCQHCEVAPCEPVCPVFAAYRTEEGLNGQVYNRCVGTRYCGNNCPYHVRRFNWFNYEFPAPLDVQLNPDVTVRQLGIMEKCTMCIQRIMAGKDHAKDEKRLVRDGDVQTACQQTCPTQAITFGNLKDDKSALVRLVHSPRAYHVLDEIGTRPSVTYLRKVVREHA
jgi:anaerobic selenocysteine-containing dehydrogenase/Fe-S-cluster-containing dehydrogenase component